MEMNRIIQGNTEAFGETLVPVPFVPHVNCPGKELCLLRLENVYLRNI